jgi:exonuclease SbcC
MIKKIKLFNWKSHKNSEFIFKKGTNVLTGIIGAGKSTVIEAMCYALFGTYPAINSKAVNLNEIIMNKPNQMEEAKVQLEFSYNGKNYFVERTIFLGKNANQAKILEEGKLIAGPKPNDVTEKIEEILEIDYDLFSRAIYSEQNQIDFFLKLSPMQRKKKFDELLELEKYEKARKTNVYVMNRIKRMVEDRKGLLKKSCDMIDENALKELKNKKKEKEKKQEELNEKEKKAREELEKELKEIDVLEKKEKKFRELNESIIARKSKITESEKKLKEVRVEIEKASKTEEEKEVEKLEKEKKEIEKKLKEVSLIKEREKAKKEKKEFLEKQRKELPKTTEKEIQEKIKEIEEQTKEIKEQTKEIERKIEEKEKELIEAKKGFLVNEKKIEEIEENTRKLIKSESECPVCSTKLSKEKKIEIINSYEKEQERIKIINKALKEEEERISREIEESKKTLKENKEKENSMEKERNEMELKKNELKKLNEIEKALKECENEIKELSELREKLEKEKLEEKLKEKEKKIKEKEKIIELIQEFSRMRQWKKETEELEKEKKELNYKENSFNEKKTKIEKIKSSLESIEKEKKSNKELIESIKENIEKIEKEKKKTEEMKKEIQKQEELLVNLSLFNSALNETQAELRKEMINTINEAMDSIWSNIYPYGDFTSIKMVIEEGNYEIKVKEKNGKWVRVEGILSGGERSIAAICIRIAFALVLTQNLSWLILDEPTHNLDSNSVSELSKMMKERLPNLVEQIFVITHDPEMEKAASASCYEIERDKENEKSSIPREFS